MDKKVEFCYLTPKVIKNNFSSAKLRNNSSTPFSKFRSDSRFEDSQVTTNLTTNNLTTSLFTANLSRSIYHPSNQQQQQEATTDRLCIEFEYLSAKFLNQKCEHLIKESNKEMENKLKKSIVLLRKKQCLVVKLSEEFEIKHLLLQLGTRFRFILNYLDNEFPPSKLSKLENQLERYRKILIPNLDSVEVRNIRNAGGLNDLFAMFNEDLCVLMDKDNEIKLKKEGIDQQRSRREQEIIRIRSLYKDYQMIYDLIKCLNKKKIY